MHADNDQKTLEKRTNCNVDHSRVQLIRFKLLGLNIKSLGFHHNELLIFLDKSETKPEILAPGKHESFGTTRPTNTTLTVNMGFRVTNQLSLPRELVPPC